ncbi:MAG: macrolide ABC transporter ATP-binding protein [Deltaproteobacteria bacterium RBG_13_49_15]|jgi:ABC-type lipoprotein export system ATPase subunit|nr:MAG: macrolide ABC transporter ATP-binding protein [Deltaproteobacteria bacterium RBG_13_49_15]
MLIEAKDLFKRYPTGRVSVDALKGIDFFADEGEFVAVMGPSGSGKSTLLYILGCLELPTSGFYRFDGMDVLTASDNALSQIRADAIGFIFQTFNLVSTLTLYENVELPFYYSRKPEKAKPQRIAEAIERVGLKDRIRHRPSELSGGEMQRVAIARALAVRPKLILADEPTGNLDSKTGKEILGLFSEMHSEGATIVMVTHDIAVAHYANRTVSLKDGKIEPVSVEV